MTPKDCEHRARLAEVHAKKALDRAALLGATFGGSCTLAQSAMREYDEARDAARIWREVACVHPQTRAKLLRDRAIPLHAFGFI